MANNEFDPSSRHVITGAWFIDDGRGERIRTSDPLVPNQVLYQAEPLPELAIGRMLTDPKTSWLTLGTRP
jgi:hypothetical protein